MTHHASSIRAVFVGATLLLSPVALARMLAPDTTAAQSAVPDPWTRVPPFPTACYAGADDVTSRLAASIEAIGADKSRQQEVNSALNTRLGTIEPMVQAQRMQAFMMKNPQEAMRAMQAVQSAGAEANALRGQSAGDYLKFGEFGELESNFQAALATALDPTHAAIAALKRAKGKDSDDGFTWSFPAAGDETRYLALFTRLNADYERLCATWLVGKGTIPAWMRAHRTYVIGEVIPKLEASDAAAAGQIRIMLGPEGGEYQSLAALDVVEDYLKKASRMNALRREGRFGPPTGFVKRAR